MVEYIHEIVDHNGWPHHTITVTWVIYQKPNTSTRPSYATSTCARLDNIETRGSGGQCQSRSGP